MAVLDELQQSVERVSQRAAPAVVGIGDGWIRGSGVVIGEGKVVTNAHNLRGRSVTVTFADGRRAAAEVAGADVDGDLAVLKAETSGVAAIDWGDRTPALGTPVFAIGNAGGELRVTFGLVSGMEREFRGPRGRRITGGIEHTAPLRPGSSGGPIVDGEGRLLGINTNRLSDGFYLAIAADESLRQRVDALARGIAAPKRRLGVAVAPPEVARRMRRAVGLPERDGLLVRAVEEGGPAARAGVEEGDLIVAVGDRSVANVDELHDLLAALEPGASLELRLARGTEERTATVAPEATEQT